MTAARDRSAMTIAQRAYLRALVDHLRPAPLRAQRVGAIEEIFVVPSLRRISGDRSLIVPSDRLTDLLEIQPVIAITGDPGAGKTFLLRNLAVEAARHALSSRSSQAL